MLGTRSKKRGKNQWKVDLLMSIPYLVPSIMGVGLLGAIAFPAPVGAVFAGLFLLPFLLIAGVLVFGALVGALGQLFR